MKAIALRVGMCWLVLAGCGGSEEDVEVEVVMDLYTYPTQVRLAASATVPGHDEDLAGFDCPVTQHVCTVSFGFREPDAIQFSLATDDQFEAHRIILISGPDCPLGVLQVSGAGQYRCEFGMDRHGLTPPSRLEARVTCTSDGLRCSPRFRFGVVSLGASLAPVVYATLPSSLCGPVVLRVYEGDSLVVESGPIGALGAISFSSPNDGVVHEYSMEAEALPDPCVGATLDSWKALLSTGMYGTFSPVQ